MAVVLDTAQLPVRDRVEAVHATMAYASAPCHVIHENPSGDVYARMAVWDLGDVSVFTTEASGIRLLRTPRQTRQDVTPVVALSVQRRADGRQEQGGRHALVAPGGLMGMDLSAPYDFSWSGDGAAGCLQIPIDRLALPVDVIRRALGNLPASPLYPLVTRHVVDVVGRADRLGADPAAPVLGAASVELARALLTSAAYATARHVHVDRAGTLLTLVRAYVRQHLADPDLRPSTIAMAHNVSLRHLYKVCAQADFSLEQWIIGERLKGAAEELLRPQSRNLTIAVVARRWGFGDPTHFARRFRAAYGLTPGQWRRMHTDLPR
ncbi:helix-turn-helix domain-containing protein [Verrucosispora sp. SN26_14.1]|uniref:helix-turn-helix domain-containing protein n=1 Tax=Verrucosispora sp. SN26_14.1 TaxID=2527879 RepID=UPI0010333C2D|nr:helix-turn-helix domain-containing protein [Verrucosispora sp. SN26_14.1]TBL34704.1 helix-turn-helix domain-containing protein [Verrucosispora sp. SN26_14.1]